MFYVYYYRYGDSLLHCLLILPGLGLISPREANTEMWTEVNLFITRIVHFMNQADPRLGMYYQYAGSTAEGTKVGLLDEVVTQFHLGGLDKALYPCFMTNNKQVALQILDTNLRKTWGEFVNECFIIQPHNLYSHLFKLFCKVISCRDLYSGLKLYFCSLDVLQRDVFLVYATNGLVIKLDPAFIVSLEKWVPSTCKEASPLLHGHTVESGCHALLQPGGWRISPYAREQLVLRSIPTIPRLAYMSMKICKDLVVYEAGERKKVKTYDI